MRHSGLRAAPGPSESLGPAGPDRLGPDGPDEAPGRTARGPEPVPDRVLEAALEVVLEHRREEWHRAAVSDDEAAQLAGVLRRYLRTGDTPATPPSGAEKSLIRRLIDLTRAEILAYHYGLDAESTLEAVRVLDRARRTFDAQWSQALASTLTGANALNLVVELAHDLRSPLTSIMFLAETLRKGQSGEINDVQRKQLGIMYSAALGMVTMASDVMDLARESSEEDFEAIEPSRFSISELIESVRLMVAPMAEEKRLDLTFLTPKHDIRLGKAVPLSRVLLNLVTNAIKFTETGGVEIVVKETAAGRVEVSVRDTGPGMTEAEVRHMFEPHQRTRSGTGFHFSGTGLGLSISRRIVEMMGDELRVESRPGHGTRFHFEIELPQASRI